MSCTHCKSAVSPLNIACDYGEEAQIHSQRRRVLYSGLPDNLIILVEIVSVENLFHLLSFCIQLFLHFPSGMQSTNTDFQHISKGVQRG